MMALSLEIGSKGRHSIDGQKYLTSKVNMKSLMGKGVTQVTNESMRLLKPAKDNLIFTSMSSNPHQLVRAKIVPRS